LQKQERHAMQRLTRDALLISPAASLRAVSMVAFSAPLLIIPRQAKQWSSLAKFVECADLRLHRKELLLHYGWKRSQFLNKIHARN
jgi:hypothetical protein